VDTGGYLALRHCEYQQRTADRDALSIQQYGGRLLL